jgi:hypothetical protein
MEQVPSPLLAANRGRGVRLLAILNKNATADSAKLMLMTLMPGHICKCCRIFPQILGPGRNCLQSKANDNSPTPLQAEPCRTSGLIFHHLLALFQLSIPWPQKWLTHQPFPHQDAQMAPVAYSSVHLAPTLPTPRVNGISSSSPDSPPSGGHIAAASAACVGLALPSTHATQLP